MKKTTRYLLILTVILLLSIPMFGCALNTTFMACYLNAASVCGGYKSVYETNNVSDYGKIKGNYDNKQPKEFITAFFPNKIEDYFTDVTYHYKAKKLDAWACECYLEFTISDRDMYDSFVGSIIPDRDACTEFQYAENYFEYNIGNGMLIWQSEYDDVGVYCIEDAQMGKILFSDTEQRIIFVAICLWDGGGTNTEELGYYFNRFNIDPAEVAEVW